MLHVHASWMAALVTEAMGLLIERATFLIPAKLVSQEGGKALILSLLGYSAGPASRSASCGGSRNWSGCCSASPSSVRIAFSPNDQARRTRHPQAGSASGTFVSRKGRGTIARKNHRNPSSPKGRIAMKALRAVFAASLLMLIAAAAQAGVVLQETETIDRGNGKPETQDRTVMVQGNQQKTATDRSQVLIDLDKGFMYVISPRAESLR